MKSHSKHPLRRALSLLLMCAMALSLLPTATLAAGRFRDEEPVAEIPAEAFYETGADRERPAEPLEFIESAADLAAVGSVTYYVSASGKGGNDGLSESAPLPGLDAVPWSQLLPGDSVLLRKGDTFPGTIRMVDVHGTADAPITIGTYGTGDAPVIEARGQGIWLPETGNDNGGTPGKYVSSGITLYDCSYITVSGLTIVNVPDTMKSSFICVDGTDRSGDKMTYSGIGVAADGVGAVEGITLTNITVRGNSELVSVKTDTSSAIATTGVTRGAVASARTFTPASGTYYVSSLNGSDANDGTSPENAFYSLHKINELDLQAGGKVYLERGSVFENQYLHIEGGGSAAQPVIIDAYGASSAPKPLINTNGNGVWYQNYRKNLDNGGHLVHGYVSSCVLLYDVPYIEIKNIAMTNFGRYGETEGADFANLHSYDGGTVPGETGYAGSADNAGYKVGCYQWGGKMTRTGVAGLAQNKGTVTHTVLQNLDIENVYGNVAYKHMDNGGIYFTASKPLDEAATGVAKFDDLRIEGCYLKRVSRWGIAAVHTAYWAELSPNGQKTVPDAVCQKYGVTNLYIGHNYLEEVGGDPITTMHAFEPFVEYNVSYNGGREMGNSSTAPRYMNNYPFAGNRGDVSAGIWPWKCKTALFEHNECYTMLYSHLGANNDGQAWDADSGDSTIYQYNYSSGNTGGCIMFCAGDAYNTVFRYNISYKDGMPWSMSNPQEGNTRRGFLDPSSAPNGQIYNNTFVVQEGTPVYHYTTGNPVKVENNIFYNLGNTYAPEGGWNAASGLRFVKNIYVGFAETGAGSYTAKDTSPITLTKSDTLFAGDVTTAPKTPKSTSKDAPTGIVNGIRDWTHDWASDFNMFKLDAGTTEAINAGLSHNYDCLTQDADFIMPLVEGGKDFYGRTLDDVHDIGAYDTQTGGGTVEEPVENACELISSLYELRGTPKTNLQVPLGTNISPTFEAFIKGLTVSDGATVKVYQSDGTTEVTDKTTKIAAGMKVKIVAADSTVNSTVYAIANKTTYNSQSDWVDNQQGNVWFYQAENNGVFINQTGMGNTYKDWTGSGGAVEQNQAVGDINNSKGAGFTFRAPVSGKVTVTFNYKAADDNAGKASASGVVTGSIRKRASTPNSKWQTWLRTYHNDTEDTAKAILIPMDSITAIPVNAMTFTVAQGDTLSFMIRNEEKETTSTDNSGNHGVYYNPVITYVDEAFTEPGDDKAPTAPGGLRAKNVTVNSANLIWNASTDNVGVDHYVITVNGTEILSNSTEPTYALTGLDEDTVYTVTVKAVDEAGNKSGEASITFRTDKTPAPEDTTAPTLTGSVTVVGSPTDTTATLSWPAGADAVGVDHYEVTVNGETVTVRNATEVTLTGLTPETNYTASVEAVDAAGNRSTPALTATFTTAAAVPDVLVAPDVFVMKVSASSADIRWRASDGADGYKVKLGENGTEQDVGDVNRYTFTGLTMNTQYTAYVRAYKGTETTEWASVTFTTPNVYNSFEDWNDNEQGNIWRYQHQDDTGAIVDHTTWNSGWSGWGGEDPGYKSVQQSQACGSIKKSQGSGYTFIAPETGTVRVSFWNYISPNAPVENQVQKREDTSSNGLNHYIRLYVDGKELTKKAIALRKDTTAQSVQPVTVAVQAGEKLSILAWNDGNFSSTGGNNGVYFNPVITYLSSAYVPEAESATLSQTSATIYTNTNETADRKHTVQLAVENIQPENANPKITWSIRPGDTGIVSVDENGLVTAKGNGAAQVTATVSSDYGDIALNFNVTVRTRMESITVKQNGTAISAPITVYANEGDSGRSVTLTAEPNPANPTHPNLNWNTVEEAGYQGVISLVKNTGGSSATITASARETDVGLAKVRVESAEHSDTFTEFTVRVVRKLANGVSITGTPKFDQTLTVNTNQLQMTQAGMNALTYQWYRTKDGTTTPISEATGRTYELEENDIGAVISVTVSADPTTFYEGEKTASITDTVAKADGGSVAAARAENCTAEGAEDGKITGLNGDFKHEYRKVTEPESGWTAVNDGATEITGLAPGKYQVRRAETDTHTAGRVYELTVLSFEEAADTYAITVGTFENGEVSASAGYAKANTEITLTIEAAEGHQLAADSLKVYKTGDAATTVTVTDNKFTMPAYPVTVEARFEKQKFTLSHELENIDCDQDETNHEVEYGDTPTIVLTAKEGYTMPPAVTVKVTGTDEEFEGYQYTRTGPDSASITFDQGITQNLTITGAGVVKSYTVNYNIRNLSAPEAEAARSVEHKAAYTGKLVADEGYALPENILITVGGASFSDFEYSSETGVITIEEGKITGNLVITTSGVDTSVDPVLVSGVRMSQTSASVKISNTITLTATVLPDEATEKMVGWSSSDPAVATVDENGEVTALAEGSAIITATTVDGGLTATCTVTVTKATPTSKPTTSTPTTEVKEDGTKVTTETKPDGTKVETVEEPDGTKAVTETKKDGTVTEKVEEPDGTKAVTETKPDGSKTATVEQPDGTKSETVVTAEGDATITVTDADGEELVKTEIPAEIPEPETKFEDISATPWAEEAINKVAGLELVKGIGGNKYDPVTPMTRGALATVLHRLSNGKTDYQVAFKDVKAAQYYTEGVAWAAKANVVKGISEDIFAPDQIITREQLAVMLARYAKLIGMSTKADTKALEQFADGDTTGAWAVDGMAWCVEKGILKGKGLNNLDPTADVSRAEVAVMLDRFIALIQK